MNYHIPGLHTFTEEDFSHESFHFHVIGNREMIMPIAGYEYDDDLSIKGNAHQAVKEFLGKDENRLVREVLDSEEVYPVLNANTAEKFKEAHKTLGYFTADGDIVGYIALPPELLPTLLSSGDITIGKNGINANNSVTVDNTIYLAHEGSTIPLNMAHHLMHHLLDSVFNIGDTSNEEHSEDAENTKDTPKATKAEYRTESDTENTPGADNTDLDAENNFDIDLMGVAGRIQKFFDTLR